MWFFRGLKFLGQLSLVIFLSLLVPTAVFKPSILDYELDVLPQCYCCQPHTPIFTIVLQSGCNGDGKNERVRSAVVAQW
jgi:hypothetical protein